MAKPPRHRILHILPEGGAGGGATAVLGLCRDLLATGTWEVGLITQPGSPLLEQAARDGIAAMPLDFFRSRLDFSLPGRLTSLIRAFGSDILHAHGARGAFPFCALRSTVPLVYTVHGFHHARLPLARRVSGRLAERRIAARADAIVFVSEGDRAQANRERILPASSLKGRVIANGIDPDDFAGIMPFEERFDLVFAGRAHPQKNPLFMVDIMERLAGSGLSLRMICGGTLEGALRARIDASPARDAIAFTGALPRREVLRAFRSARLFVLPSLWEGLPIAPIEALTCGIPVVASRIGGTDEIIVDGINGRLIEPFDAGLYAGAIREILASPALHARLVANGRALVEARFIRTVNSARHDELYRHMLQPAHEPHGATESTPELPGNSF